VRAPVVRGEDLLAGAEQRLVGSSAPWCTEIVAVARPLAVESQRSSAASVRYSSGQRRSGKSRAIRARSAAKHAGPRSTGTEYSISVCLSLRSFASTS
jgi:hypothetical protein